MDTLQFRIPTRAANAIDSPALQKRSKADGIAHWWLERNEHDAGPAKVRITCDKHVAALLLEAVAAAAGLAEERRDSELLLDCGEAARATIEAVDAMIGRKPDSPGKGIGRAMG